MRRDEAGFSTIEFMVLLGFGLLVATGLMVASAWPAEINAVNAAAYEAARAAVEAPNAADGEATGRERAAEVMANHGFAGTDMSVSYTSAQRGEALTATVHVTLPSLRFPWVGSWDALPFSKSSTQRVPDYRSVE